MLHREAGFQPAREIETPLGGRTPIEMEFDVLTGRLKTCPTVCTNHFRWIG